jgi:N-acetylmuramoyl-L-alanine amidase
MNTRNIKYIVVHCTATPPTTSLESIKRYWKEVKKWGDTPGYHYLIDAEGTTHRLLEEHKNSFGVYAHNSECINLSYIGGIDNEGKPKDTRSLRQQVVMHRLIKDLQERYPKAEVLGHRDFPNVAKACPSFDVKSWLKHFHFFH